MCNQGTATTSSPQGGAPRWPASTIFPTTLLISEQTAPQDSNMVVVQRHTLTRPLSILQESHGLVSSLCETDNESEDDSNTLLGSTDMEEAASTHWPSATLETCLECGRQGGCPHTCPQRKLKSKFNEFARKYSRSFKFAIAACGILCSYLIHGSVQEDLFLYTSPIDGSKFGYAWLLQALESSCNVFFAFIVQAIFYGETPDLPVKSLYLVGTSQLFAKTFTSLSLAAGLSFPVCTLSKSAKMVPVMIGQLAVGSSSFSWKDYTVAAAIVSGTVILSLGNAKEKDGNGHSGSASETTLLGIAFILVSLFMDGITAGLQSFMKRRMRNAGQTLKTNDMLLHVNLSMALCAFAFAHVSGDWYLGTDYLLRNPEAWNMVMTSCICSVIGQTFIFFMIEHFDPLACATVTTSRKILSVIWSIVAKGHSLSNVAAFGVALAVCGLVLETQKNISSSRPSSKL
ncbi:hypothetical protein ACA910_000036 [Epithemia clementina (nom. ined.)]